MARILMCVSFAHKIGREQKVSEGGRERFFSSYYPILSLVFFFFALFSIFARPKRVSTRRNFSSDDPKSSGSVDAQLKQSSHC